MKGLLPELSMLLVPLLALSTVVSTTDDYDFFYLVLQWPGSYCDTKSSCCYPTTGKPEADFGLHGLWPTYNNGSYPSNCDADSAFDSSQVEDLISRMQAEWPTLACPSSDGLSFWSHEWDKHGTCSESVLTQQQYFQRGLEMRKQVDLLNVLTTAGMMPDDSFYKLKDFTEAIKGGTGYTPGLQCNVDPEGNRQPKEVYLCVNKAGNELIECPTLKTSCSSKKKIQFPAF